MRHKLLVNKAFLASVILLLTLLSTSVFAKLIIISPVDNMYTEKSSLTVTGVEDSADKDSIAIVVEGTDDEEDVQFIEEAYIINREFNHEVDLYPGMNNITVGNIKFKVFYNDGSLVAPIEFTKVNYHKVVLSGCSECHDTSEQDLPLIDDKGALCKKCHPQYMKIVVVRSRTRTGKIIRKKKEILYKNLHKPIMEGECLICHKPHYTTTKSLLIQDPVNPLCEGCHKKIFDAIKIIEEPHPPQKKGKCIECHSPHASEEKYLFKKSLKFICFNCHESFFTDSAGAKKRSIHKYTLNGICYECHNLHYTEMKDKFLKESSIVDICLKCHKNKDSGKHTSEKTSCISCHDPHSSDFETLFATDEIDTCKECHTDEFKGKIVHGALRNSCQSCHDDLHKLQELELTRVNCYKCHDDKEYLNVTHGNFDIPIEKCSSCHKPHSSTEATLLSKAQHQPFKLGECNSCHIEDNERNILLKTAGASLCFECHRVEQLLKGKTILKNIHTPFREGKCLSCHDPHAADFEKLLLGLGSEICINCHTDTILKVGGVEYKNIHSPVEDSDCFGCHNAHGSQFGNNLIARVEDICTNCHNDYLDGISADVKIHPPYKTGNCAACHNPHASDTEHLVKTDIFKTCGNCHDDVTKDGDGNLYRTLHKPVKDKNCSACHGIHTAKYEKQLKLTGNTLCESCHENKVGHHTLKYESKSEQIVIEKGFKREDDNFACIGCHDPHAADIQYLFNPTREAVCDKCHNK